MSRAHPTVPDAPAQRQEPTRDKTAPGGPSCQPRPAGPRGGPQLRPALTPHNPTSELNTRYSKPHSVAYGMFCPRGSIRCRCSRSRGPPAPLPPSELPRERPGRSATSQPAGRSPPSPAPEAEPSAPALDPASRRRRPEPLADPTE